jgi:hypothetical protein
MTPTETEERNPLLEKHSGWLILACLLAIGCVGDCVRDVVKALAPAPDGYVCEPRRAP